MSKKDKPEFVQCMKCDNYDPADSWCLRHNKPMTPYPELFKCRRFFPID